MLWFTNKVNRIISEINSQDIAFLFTSLIEINRQKRSKLKAQVALKCLISHKSFGRYMFELYLMERTNKLRCVAISGVLKEIYNLYYGRAVLHDSRIYSVFYSKKIFFDKNFDNEKGRRSELLKKINAQSSLLLPIANFGDLVVNKLDKNNFNDYEILLLKNFVYEVIGPSLELALDNEKNFNSAIRDPLTGLYNHGYFMSQIEREINNAKRGKYKISLIMIDVDYFKHYNDLNGHPKGDQVLISIANLLKHNTRNGDIAARYGGEEFVVILYNTNIKLAAEKAERLRKTIADYNFYKKEMQPNGNLTISLGVANFPSDADESKELIEKADKALYFSKNSGKNRVSVYGKEVK